MLIQKAKREVVALTNSYQLKKSDYPRWLALKIKMIAKRLMQHDDISIKTALEMIYASTEYELLANFDTGYWDYFFYDSYCIIAESNHLTPIPYNQYKGVSDKDKEILDTLLPVFEVVKANLGLDPYHYYRPLKVLFSVIDSNSWKGKTENELEAQFTALLEKCSDTKLQIVL